MDHRVDAHIARTQLGQIMDRAVERRGEPAVVIMSVKDYIRTASPPPDWLRKAWDGAKKRGLDKVTPTDIDVEIAAWRHGKKRARRPGAR